MSRFRVVKALRMDSFVMTGRTMDEGLTWREANSAYLSYQGRRKGERRLEGTPNVIRQDENFVEMKQQAQR